MKLKSSEYKLIVESSPNMIWRSGLDAACNYFNKTWLEFTGKTMEQETGSGWLQGVHPEDMDACLKTYLIAFEKREKFEMDYRLMHHDGRYRWINDRGVPIFSNGVFTGYIGSCMDITEKVEGQALKIMAEMDGVCGIFNRQFSYKLLLELINKTPQFSLIMLDIDDFKKINDDYGHLTGDEALKHVAAILQKHIRPGDILGRYGGDEFIIGLPETCKQDAVAAGERLIETLKTQPLVLPDGLQIAITLSVGITAHKPNEALEELINRADRALYQAKQTGKNQAAALD